MLYSQAQLKSAYKEVEARSDGPELLVEYEGRLKQIQSDGELVHDFGMVGFCGGLLSFSWRKPLLEPVTKDTILTAPRHKFISFNVDNQIRIPVLKRTRLDRANGSAIDNEPNFDRLLPPRSQCA